MRRRAGALLVVLWVTLSLGQVSAQARAIKIGVLTALSGPFAPWGVNVRDGMRLAATELNEAGGVAGLRVELMERDDRNNPAEAVNAFRFLVEREGVVGAGGVISSDVGLAVAREAEALRTPWFLTMAGAHTILQRDSRYTFRTCLVAAPMNVEAIAQMVRHERLSRVGAIVADYGWGHAVRVAVERQVASLPGVRVQIEVAPVGTSDFTPYLRRLQGLDPQLLIALGHPPGTPVIVRQAAELGMRQRIVGPWYPFELIVQRAGEAVFGRYLDYSCADVSSPAYQGLARKFFAQYRRFFDHNALSGYAIVKLVAHAVEKVGRPDPRAVAESIRRGRFVLGGYAYPLSYTEWGELKEARPIFYSVVPGEAPGGVCPGCGWALKYEFRSTRLRPYVPEQ